MYYFLKIFLLLTSTTTVMSSECSRFIGNCEFYQCREEIHSCGENGYYTGFGQKYCYLSKTSLIHKMSANGKIWIKDVALCLQKSANKIPESQRCEKVFTLAVAEHSDCYIQAGFCSLPFKDQFHIVNMLKYELNHPEIMREGGEILEACK